jgi:hypothetical protein
MATDAAVAVFQAANQTEYQTEYVQSQPGDRVPVIQL